MVKNLCVSQRPYKLTTFASGSFSPASPLLDRTSTVLVPIPVRALHRVQSLVEKNKNESLTSGLYGLGAVELARMIAEDAFCADKE